MKLAETVEARRRSSMAAGTGGGLFPGDTRITYILTLN